MPLPVIAAGAARVAAVAGRSVGAGKGAASAVRAGKTGSRAMRTGNNARPSTSQMRSQLQQGRARTQQLKNFRPPRTNKTSNEETPEEMEDTDNTETSLQNLQKTAQAFASPDASRMAKFKMATSMLKQFHAMQAATPEEAKPTQDATKKMVKKMIPKMALFIANSFASTLEVITAGFASPITFFIRFITLGWYNIEMIYGGWITKGKHKFIGPLTWDPIPMPFPKNDGTNALGPMILTILADIFFIIMLMLPIVIIGTLLLMIASANPF